MMAPNIYDMEIMLWTRLRTNTCSIYNKQNDNIFYLPWVKRMHLTTIACVYVIFKAKVIADAENKEILHINKLRI